MPELKGDQIPWETPRRHGESSEAVPEETWRELRGCPRGDVERAQRLSRRRRGESSEAVPEETWRELRGCPRGDVERVQRLSRRRPGESSGAVPEETWREFRGCRYCCTWLFFFG
nr:protein FAM74A4/A6-like [Macaca nemestrina]